MKQLQSRERRSIRRTKWGAAVAGRPKKIESPIFKRSLPLLLANYIEFANSIPNRTYNPRKSLRTAAQAIAFLDIFNDKTLSWLSSKGYDITDLTTWEWILTAQSSEQAAIRLTMLANQRDQKIGGGKPIPTFVFLFLLRRQDFSPRSLRLLLEQAGSRLIHRNRLQGGTDNSPCSPGKPENAVIQVVYSEMDEKTLMTMVVRLLRQARKVWPAAMVSIAEMMTKYVNGSRTWSKSLQRVPLNEQTSARLTFLYNKMLSLLAIPSNQSPFKLVVYHQRSQFVVLKRMNEFQPPLIVTREGYRAVTSVQLAHTKTYREREWAMMKALSWPPWKEDKLGIDRDIGAEHGISRASESLMRSREAGYPSRAWEDAAGVFAGWDTDHSPTIQTRTILNRGTFFDQLYNSAIPDPEPAEPDKLLWAARIRATRTVDEAWACFLTYRYQKESWPSETVYYAMFEKLVYEDKRVKSVTRCNNHAENSEAAVALPGDGKETFAVPGPPQAIYVRTPTPSMNELYDMMVEDNIKPSGRFLGFLWSHADSFNSGIKYLTGSSIRSTTIQVLLGRDVFKFDRRKAELELLFIEDHLFAAFISLLCGFAPYNKGCNIGSDARPGELPLKAVLPKPTMDMLGRTHINPISQAFQLVGIRKPFYRPPWNSLLLAVAPPGRVVSNIRTHDLDVQDMLTWKVMRHVLVQMQEINLDVDFHGFRLLCVGLEKAILASQKLLLRESDIPADRPGHSPRGDSHLDDHLKLDAEQVLTTGISFLKKKFKILVGTPNLSRTIKSMPRLLETPDAAELHAFVRVLGLCKDYDGILELVRWMRCYAPELGAVAEKPVNGQNPSRRCIVAIRVFLEQSWLFMEDKRERASPELLHEAITTITKKNDWGGWPTDEDVRAYIARWKSQLLWRLYVRESYAESRQGRKNS